MESPYAHMVSLKHAVVLQACVQHENTNNSNLIGMLFASILPHEISIVGQSHGAQTTFTSSIDNGNG